jgi:hypothetical protein
MDDYEAKAVEARERLFALIIAAAKQTFQYDGDQGKWSQADFDEIEVLAEFLGADLPTRFHKVLAGGYPGFAGGQKNTAERLLRILEVVPKYGVPSSRVTENDQELTPTFQLTTDDKELVLELSSKIRMIIFSSPLFDQPHKRRLLNRIAAIEREIHQPKGRLDVILAGISDVGDAAKKFGTDLKPIVDRMTEIKRITQTSSSEYDQIPPPEEKLSLPAPDEDE